MSRKRKAENDDDSQDKPRAKKPKMESMYTRTDPITGEIGRIRKKDDEYWRNFSRRAKYMQAARKKAAEEERKANEKTKKQKTKTKPKIQKKETENDSSSSESEISDIEIDSDVKRDDKSKFMPFYKLTNRFKDHVCVVTGGGRGIGKACALRLAQEGGIVYILDNKRWKETIDSITLVQRELHNEKYASSMAKYHAECNRISKNKNKNKNKTDLPRKPRKLKFKERVFHKKCDVTDSKNVCSIIDLIIGERGYIDVLLNCVNSTTKDYGSTDSHRISSDVFDKIIKLNLYSTVNVCNAVIPYMKKENYGRIVNLANVDGKNGHPKCLAFSAAKAAVINVTKTLGQEYAGTGITVNCIAPQYDEYHYQKVGKKYAEKASKVPMGRAIDMEELAGTVAFIASEENTYTTGFCYDLSGGTSTY